MEDLKKTTEERKRSIQQNRALHVLFGLMAEALNGAGWDMKKTLKPEIDIPWSAETIKEFIWKPIQEAQLGKRSTTELTTKQVNEIYETIMRHFGEKFGITVDFPSIEMLMREDD
jgi:hypothetical protein